MRSKLLTFSFMLAIIGCFPSGATAADMAPEYLHGNWVIGPTEQICGAVDSEYFNFQNNGTFEAGRSGKAEAVGFWQINGDVLKLDFISSPGFFQDIHGDLKEWENLFDYFSVKVVSFNVEENRFEGVGVLGDQIQKGIAVNTNFVMKGGS